MGVIQFDVEFPEHVPRHGLHHADFVMFDGRIISSETTLNDGRLHCHRPQTDSSHLRILYQPHVDGAPVVTHTTSLRECDTVYRLEVELARGELSRLRNFYGAWVGAGLQTTDVLERLLKDAQRVFFRSTADGSANDAIQALLTTRDAVGELCRLYTTQRLAFRRERAANFPMSLGCTLQKVPDSPERFLEAFTAAMLQTSWRDLEPQDGQYCWDEFDTLVNWASDQRLLLQGGPLIDLVNDSFPEWMNCWRGDMINMQSFASDFVETVVSRYIGKIRHWEVVYGGNCGGSCGLSEEQRLNLVIRSVEAARQVDEQIQISLRIVQPWGEYLSDTANRLAPIQFIDTLRRTGVRIAEVNLDIHFGMQPRYSLPRDRLGLSQLLDHWSLLQTPVNVILSLPEFFPDAEPTPQLDEVQSQWLQQTLLMCLSKERVTGVTFDSWQDRPGRKGLLLPTGTLHPAWNQFCRLEAEFWPRNNPGTGPG